LHHGIIMASPRALPDSEDWTRAYLRARGVPCEGPQLQAALHALDAVAWRRLKDAWRQRVQRDTLAQRMGGALARQQDRTRELGPRWRRLIGWGVLSETEAAELASELLLPGVDDKLLRFGDAGAAMTLTSALQAYLVQLRAATAPTPRQVGTVAAVVKLLGGEPPETFDQLAARAAAAGCGDLLDGLGDVAHQRRCWGALRRP
jgi:hypothetical protein